MMKDENILDSEIRVIGGAQKPPKSPFRWYQIAIIVGVAVIIGLIVWWQWSEASDKPDEPGLFEQEQPIVQPHPLIDWFASIDTIKTIGTVSTDISINDILLRVYAPLNSTPHLETGYKIADNSESSILFFQAADVRADNGKIVGAFVLHGKPLSWGLSKRGYCAIINGEVTVGVADNSPLFEKATDENGDFFRQYPLVDNGNLVENELKSKSIRRALCEVEGHVVVVETQSVESMHDFAQALVDIGTSNAIYLVGSSAIGWYMDAEGNGTKIGIWEPRKIKNISFIVWAK